MRSEERTFIRAPLIVANARITRPPTLTGQRKSVNGYNVRKAFALHPPLPAVYLFDDA